MTKQQLQTQIDELKKQVERLEDTVKEYGLRPLSARRGPWSDVGLDHRRRHCLTALYTQIGLVATRLEKTQGALRIDLDLVAEVLDYEFFITEEQPAKRGIRIKDDE